MFAIAIRTFPLLSYFAFDHGTVKAKCNKEVVTKVRNLATKVRRQLRRNGMSKEERRIAMQRVVQNHEFSRAVKSKTAGVKVIGRCINFAVKRFLNEVGEYCYGVKGDEFEVDKRDRTFDAMDILGIIIRPRAEAWGEQVAVSPTTLLLVDEFRHMDEHYQYTKREIDIEDEEPDAETLGDVLEQQYNASVDPRT